MAADLRLEGVNKPHILNAIQIPIKCFFGGRAVSSAPSGRTATATPYNVRAIQRGNADVRADLRLAGL
jgi:hypothetical protein